MKRILSLFRCFRDEIKKQNRYAFQPIAHDPSEKADNKVLSFQSPSTIPPAILPTYPFLSSPVPSPKSVPLNDSDYLYVILPYFNFCRYQSRTRLFTDFVERIRHEPKVRIVVVEARLANEEFQLPAEMEGVYKYIGIQTTSECWLKESLINLGISSLPNTWVWTAWIDADITFLNQNWVNETITMLLTRDVVQMFHALVYMGPDGEALKIERSFGYMYLDSGVPYTKNDKYGHFMPGMAWAMNHRAYKAMGGLIDWAILGSADRHMAYAMIGRVEDSCPGNIGEGYKMALHEFQSRCRRSNLKLGYIRGTILHHWHGRLEDRKYRERWDILVKQKYDPEVDVYYNQKGLVQLTDRGKRMAEDLRAYFMGRKEDNNQVKT